VTLSPKSRFALAVVAPLNEHQDEELISVKEMAS
jgi:hypothetical protein